MVINVQRNESNKDGVLYNKFSILERGFVMRIDADVVIVGTGVAGLFSALNLPRDKKIVMITKADLESSDSFLAQGGICVLHDKDDYDSYFEDTMKAGHYENRKESVDIMIRSSAKSLKNWYNMV